jgi:hypothetical protein
MQVILLVFDFLILISGSAAMFMRSALFWEIMERRAVIVYRRFGTKYRSHLQGSRSPRRTNIPEERRFIYIAAKV